MNNTTNSWEKNLDTFIDNLPSHVGETPRELLKGFIGRLLHDTEIAAREKGEKDGFIEGAESMKAKAKETVRNQFIRMMTVFDGKLPYVFFNPSGDEEERYVTIWKTAVEESIKAIDALNKLTP